ncbi:MAG TPA: EAL domain-containing protein [Croceibacterium sp.]|nr:EAL domain-containing protein [Croceibacterium sp.]
MARPAPLARGSGRRRTGRLGEAEFSSELLDLATDCVFAVDGTWRFKYVNRRAAIEIAGGRSLLGQSLWDEFPALVGTDIEAGYRKAMLARQPARFEAYYGPHDRWYEVDISPLSQGGLAVWFRNIDERKRAERQLQHAEERYRLAASAATDLVVDWNLETGEIIWREALQSGFGFGDGIVRTREWCIAQVHPDDREPVSAAIRRCIETGERLTYECRVRKADGSYAEVHQTAVAQHDVDGRPLRIILAVRDQTAWNRANEAIRSREAQLANIFSQAIVGIVESGPDGRARLVNERFCEILGRSESEVLGTEVMEFTHPADMESVQALLRAKRVKGESFQTEKRYLRPNGDIVWCKLSVSFVVGPSGAIESSIAIAEDISQQRHAIERLKWTSEHDDLTGLANRRAFEACLQAATLRSMHTHDTVGLLLLDLDHFKHVNDRFGHAAGDELLQEIGDRLAQCVAAGDLVARLGGDEFAVVVERCTAGADLLEIGDTILRQLRRPFQIGGRTISLDGSIGGAMFPGDAESAHELFQHADVALYALKESGRGGTRLFDRDMLDQALVVASQLAAARTAVSGRSVDPHYQPKVDLESGRIVGFEALLRWHDEACVLQSPDTLAEAFRDYELASRIGELVQRRVFGDLNAWLREGLPVGCIALNAAPAEFLRDDFAERLLDRLREHHVLPSCVELEVTEHVFLDQGAQFVARALNLLHQNGVRIALDDFGTGYSSLSHLRDFPVDVVKIDRSFVHKVTSNHDARAIVSAIVTLAKSLNIEVVAEGIETDRQRRVLQEEGCHFGQGYYFGRAVSAAEVKGLLHQSCSALP